MGLGVEVGDGIGIGFRCVILMVGLGNGLVVVVSGVRPN